MTTVYEIIIRGFVLMLRLAAFFHPKAKKWIAGRRRWRTRYRADFQKKNRVLWVHAASLGEFEQGRPVIEMVREKWPDWQVVLTFFSPSGYEIRQNYPHADFIAYLPADTCRNARDFLQIIQPDAAIIIKYEFWANYLFALKKRRTPTLLVSALFRENQPFFRWYGGLWRRMLRCFTHVFVQNEASEKLLRGLGFQNVTTAGDTRVDRVLRIAAEAPENELVKKFTSSSSGAFLAGSSWPADEAVFLPVLEKREFQHFKIIIAPHEPSETHLKQLENRLLAGSFSDGTQLIPVRYSRVTAGKTAGTRVLVIDNVGILNTLYRYGTVAYIGGGFGRGIHNTLEPAAWGLPVIFGPKYQKFEEARQLVARGGAFSVRDQDELAAVLEKLGQPESYQKATAAVRGYLEESRGATARVLAFLERIVREV